MHSWRLGQSLSGRWALAMRSMVSSLMAPASSSGQAGDEKNAAFRAAASSSFVVNTCENSEPLKPRSTPPMSKTTFRMEVSCGVVISSPCDPAVCLAKSALFYDLMPSAAATPSHGSTSTAFALSQSSSTSAGTNLRMTVTAPP